MPHALEQMTPEEELATMREQLGIIDSIRIMDRIIESFSVLQARASMLISLVALCLTISGFSGHRIAAAGPLPAKLMSFGLLFSVLAAFLLFIGPLQLRWATQYRHPDGMDARLIAMIRLRNHRTQRYHQAAGVLIFGLTCYLSAVILSLLAGGAG